jgi:HlyD family secretion protein
MNRSKWIMFGLVAVAVVLVVGSLTVNRRDPTQYLSAKVERGDINDVVEASGTVNALKTVLVGSQVSGTIIKLNVDFNSRVHRGDVVALIDPALFKGALEQTIANLASARAQLQKDTANLAYDKANYERYATLVKQNSASLDAADNSKNLYGQATAQVELDKASIQQSEAAVEIARTNLEYTNIRSPVDGVVVARNVDVGQTVAASLQAPTIFTIAQDLTKMQLYAKTDESEIGRIKVGRHVTFKVDAFPKDLFQGVVSQMRMNATTIQNVVTYDTIIDFDNPDLRLFPGMTAYVTVPVATVKDVVKVPNAALRFNPPISPDAVRDLYSKFRIDGNLIDSQTPSSIESPAASSKTNYAVVWKIKPDNSIEPVMVELGITDHAYTEVKRIVIGTIAVGDVVATGSIAAKPRTT